MFLDFLKDVILAMGDFRDDIATVYFFHDDDRLCATGNHPNRLIFYQATPHDQIDEVHAPLYIGALSYLRSLLGSSMMKDNARVEITYKEQGGNKVCATSMRFITKSLVSDFECTNPEILNEKDRVRQFPRPKDAVFFQFTKEMYKQFEEAAKFNTPKSDMRLFTLEYDGNYIRAIFGNGKNISNLILSDTVTGFTDQKIKKLVSLDRFRSMIKLAGNNDGSAGFHPNAVWVDFPTTHALHIIVSPTIREQK